MTANNISSLYLHVPFCAAFCHYCDFARQIYRTDAADRWLDAVEKELSGTPISSNLETIYIGGGTPSCLNAEQTERLLGLLDPYALTVREYTVECNPELNDEDRIRCFARHGVNRVSIGLQSSDRGLLRSVNRRHDAADVKRLVHQFFACGISNISLDLMYGLPGQTMEQLDDSISFALSCDPKHLSLYSLTVEPGSVFGRNGVKQIAEDLEADMYERICRMLEHNGFIHYEVSNFALPGYESVHNTNVWHYDDFYGIGYGAWGKDSGGRYEHSASLKEYCSDPLYRNYTRLSRNEQMFEMLMMGLRLQSGVPLSVFASRYGISFAEAFPKAAASLYGSGLLAEKDGYVFCTAEGWPLLNSVLVEFMEEAGL